MSFYRLTPAARDDLIEIWNYTAEQWSPEQAERYLLSIETCLNTLADNPEMGRERPEINADYLSFPVEQHVIFYLRAPDHIQVIGILHGRIDVESQLAVR